MWAYPGYRPAHRISLYIACIAYIAYIPCIQAHIPVNSLYPLYTGLPWIWPKYRYTAHIRAPAQGLYLAEYDQRVEGMGPGPAQRGASDHGSLPLNRGMCNTRFDADLARKWGISGYFGVSGPGPGALIWGYSGPGPEALPTGLRSYLA